MTSLRRHLRPWVTAWLLCQVASLSALVPRDCCAAHRPATSHKAPRCHEAAAATHCPMRAADGTPCPMHRGQASGAGERPGDRCSLRGTCAGPMAGLAALLSNHGVLTEPFAMLPDLPEGRITVHAREHLISRLAPPDPPPPRA